MKPRPRYNPVAAIVGMHAQVFDNLRIPIGGFLFEIEYLCKQNIATMERKRLSHEAKGVMFALRTHNIGTCPETMLQSAFNAGARELQSMGLAVCHEEEGGNVEIVRLTDYGKLYLESNPRLRNPIDWKWVITTTITAIAAIASSIALFVACKVINH